MSKSRDYVISKLKEWNCPVPTIHFVLGSGIAGAYSEYKIKSGWKEIGQISFEEIPGFHAPTAPGHKGVYKYYTYQDKFAASFQTGRLHGYEGISAKEAVHPVIVPFECGTRNFVLTNAAGSLQLNFKGGSTMLIEDHVNFTGQNPLTGPNPKNAEGKEVGPRFPDMSSVYNRQMNEALGTALKKNHMSVNQGIYIGLSGPSFETPAEVKLFSKWGMGAAGMSTVWEAIALKHRGAEIGAFSFLSNMGAGLGEKEGEALTGEEVLEAGKKASVNLLSSLFDFAENYF